GNFLVYADGEPAIVDVGVETYTAKTFSPQRYDIWTMQSAYHNCPTVGGVMESPGLKYSASGVAYHADDRSAQLRMNLAGAYPPEAHLATWNRTMRLDRGANLVEVLDEYRLAQVVKVITLTLMTPCTAQISGPGEIVLGLKSGGRVRVAYDA